MKKRFIILSLFLLTSCSQKTEIPIETTVEIRELSAEDNQALDIIKEYFAEEEQNRIFEVIENVEVEGKECIQIKVSGIYNSGLYPIDLFAVDLSGEKLYFFNANENKFIEYYTIPYYACATSPNRMYRIESVGMNFDGPSGLHALSKMRIIDLRNAEEKWADDSFLDNSFIWSENSEYVSYVRYTRVAAESAVIARKDFSLIDLPNMYDILNSYKGELFLPNENRPDPFFIPKEWISENIIRVDFSWTSITDTEVSGFYDFDVNKNEITNIEIIQNGASE